jgi:hypothetical protein
MRSAIGFAVFGCVLVLAGSRGWAEEITLTTYYPSPRGMYEELRTTNNTNLATVAGAVLIGPDADGVADASSRLEVAGNINVIAAVGTRAGLHVYEDSIGPTKLRAAIRMDNFGGAGDASGVGTFYVDTGELATVMTARTEAQGSNLFLCSGTNVTGSLPCLGGNFRTVEIRDSGTINTLGSVSIGTLAAPAAPVAPALPTMLRVAGGQAQFEHSLGDVWIGGGDVIVTDSANPNIWHAALWNNNSGNNGMATYYPNGKAMGGFVAGAGGAGALLLCGDIGVGDAFCSGGSYASFIVNSATGAMTTTGTATFKAGVRIVYDGAAIGEALQIVSSAIPPVVRWQAGGGNLYQITAVAPTPPSVGCAEGVQCTARAECTGTVFDQHKVIFGSCSLLDPDLNAVPGPGGWNSNLSGPGSVSLRAVGGGHFKSGYECSCWSSSCIAYALCSGS